MARDREGKSLSVDRDSDDVSPAISRDQAHAPSTNDTSAVVTLPAPSVSMVTESPEACDSLGVVDGGNAAASKAAVSTNQTPITRDLKHVPQSSSCVAASAAARNNDGSTDNSGSARDVELKKCEQDIDVQLEEKASRAKLTANNIKTILQEVLTHEDVVAMLRNSLEDDVDKHTPATYEPKMTRAKVKQVLAKEGNVPAPWPLSPAKAKDAASLFGDIVFADEEDDDEYSPDRDILADESDDDESAIGGSQADDVGSPAPSDGVLSPACSAALVSSPALVMPPPATMERSGSARHIMPPVISSAVSPCLKTSKASEKQFLEALAELQLEPPIAGRTRSKAPLTEKTLECLEAEFIAPDVTPDMYDADQDADSEWKEFLHSMFITAGEQATDEEESDPEYNILADIEEEEEEDEEDYHKGCTVKISKNEIHNLMDELVEALEGDEDMPSSPAAEPKPSFNMPPKMRLESWLVKDLLRDAAEGRLLIPSHVDARPSADVPLPLMTAVECLQLHEHMRKHVQLLTQVFVLTVGVEELKSHNAAAEQLITELAAFRNCSPLQSRSCFNACNLDEALKAVADSDHLVAAFRRSRGDVSSSGVHATDSETREGFVAAKTPGTGVPALPSSSLPKPADCLSSEEMQYFANSMACIYPSLMPLKRLSIGSDHSPHRRQFLPTEDNLIVMGLEQFEGTSAKYKLIHSLLVPRHSAEVLKARVRRMMVPGKSNVIRSYLRCKELPPIQRFLEVFDQSLVCRPIDWDKSVQHVPLWLKEMKGQQQQQQRLAASQPPRPQALPQVVDCSAAADVRPAGSGGRSTNPVASATPTSLQGLAPAAAVTVASLSKEAARLEALPPLVSAAAPRGEGSASVLSLDKFTVEKATVTSAGNLSEEIILRTCPMASTTHRRNVVHDGHPGNDGSVGEASATVDSVCVVSSDPDSVPHIADYGADAVAHPAESAAYSHLARELPTSLEAGTLVQDTCLLAVSGRRQVAPCASSLESSAATSAQQAMADECTGVAEGRAIARGPTSLVNQDFEGFLTGVVSGCSDAMSRAEETRAHLPLPLVPLSPVKDTSAASSDFQDRSSGSAASFVVMVTPTKRPHLLPSASFKTPSPRKHVPRLMPAAISPSAPVFAYTPLSVKKTLRSPRRRLLRSHARQVMPKGFVLSSSAATAPSFSCSPSKLVARSLTQRAVKTVGCGRGKLVPVCPGRDETLTHLKNRGAAATAGARGPLGKAASSARGKRSRGNGGARGGSDVDRSGTGSRRLLTLGPMLVSSTTNKNHALGRAGNGLCGPGGTASLGDDEDDDLAALMEASTTIRLSSEPDAAPLRLKKRKLERNLACLAADLMITDKLRDEKDTALARAFLSRSRSVLGDGSTAYLSLIATLAEFDNGDQTPAQLFHSVREILCSESRSTEVGSIEERGSGTGDDSERKQQLLCEFSAFLAPQQAFECGLQSYTASVEYERSRRFLRKLEVYFGKSTAPYQKIMRLISGWDEGKQPLRELKESVVPLLKGHPHLLEDFMTFCPEEAACKRFSQDYEEIDLSMCDDGALLSSASVLEGFEEVEMPDIDDTHATERCRCLCHSELTGSSLYHQRSVHCRMCCVKVMGGKLYIHTLRGFKPAYVSFEGKEAPAAPPSDDCKADESSSPPHEYSEYAPAIESEEDFEDEEEEEDEEEQEDDEAEDYIFDDEGGGCSEDDLHSEVAAGSPAVSLGSASPVSDKPAVDNEQACADLCDELQPWRRDEDKLILETLQDEDTSGDGSDVVFQHIACQLNARTPGQVRARFHHLLDLFATEYGNLPESDSNMD